MIILELCWKLLIDTLQYKLFYFAGNYFFFNYVFLRFGFSSFIPWMLFTAIKSVGCCCCFIPLIRLCGLFIQCVFFFLYSCFGVTQALNWKLFISLICTKPTKKKTHTQFFAVAFDSIFCHTYLVFIYENWLQIKFCSFYVSKSTVCIRSVKCHAKKCMWCCCQCDSVSVVAGSLTLLLLLVPKKTHLVYVEPVPPCFCHTLCMLHHQATCMSVVVVKCHNLHWCWCCCRCCCYWNNVVRSIEWNYDIWIAYTPTVRPSEDHSTPTNEKKLYNTIQYSPIWMRMRWCIDLLHKTVHSQHLNV